MALTINTIEGFEEHTTSLGPAAGQGWTTVTNRWAISAGRNSALTYNQCFEMYGNGFETASLIKTVVAQASGSVAWAVSAATGEDNALLVLREGATEQLRVTRLMSDNKLRVVRGDGTVLATSTLAYSDLTAWNHFELTYTIADSGGLAQLRVNGSKIIDFTGDTRNGGTAGTVDTVIWTTSGVSIRVDDVVIGSTTDVIGDVKVETLLPSGAGDTTQWTPSAGSNYACVDDFMSTTDYVSTLTPNQRDLYALADCDPSLGTVMAVQIMAFVAKADAGTPAGTVKSVEKAVSTGTIRTEAVVDNSLLTTSYAWQQSSVHQTDPDGSAWSTAKVNGLQAGVEIS